MLRTAQLSTARALRTAPRLMDRSLARRIRHARIGGFKPIVDFDWKWPRKVERQGIDDLFGLGFLADVSRLEGLHLSSRTGDRFVAHSPLEVGFDSRFRG